MTGSRLVVALTTAAAIAAVVACGGAPMHKVQSNTSPPVPAPGGEHDAIVALDARIAADVAAQGGAEPTPEAIEAASTMSIADAAGVCVRPLGDVCGDSCQLSDSICSAASEICKLAAQLPGDAWASGRCDAGKASCADSARRCCECGD